MSVEKQSKKIKKEKLLMVVLTLFLILALVGTTYAIFTFIGGSSDDNLVTTGTISMSYTEPSNALVLENALPMSDEEGMNQTNYFEFDVTSNATGKVEIPYEINITPLSIDEDKKQLPENIVKFYLVTVNDTETAVKNPTTFDNLSTSIYRSNSKELATQTHDHNDILTITTKYRLRVWIDESFDVSEEEVYQYKFRVNVDSSILPMESNPLQAPTVTTMYVGGNTDPEYATTTKTTIYAEWEDKDVTAYCVSNTNDLDNCSWTTITIGETSITENYTLTENNEVKTIYFWLRDINGNISEVKMDTIILDTTTPIISEVYSGGMIYKDPNFSSGLNSAEICNNLVNGTVTAERVAMETPVGNYALQITTSGEAFPGLGGFYFSRITLANEIDIIRILAKIPVGYSINWASNSTGDGSSNGWLTDTAGTGEWKEYVHVAIAGSTGSSYPTSIFYLTGEAATAENPVTWYVAYATLYSDQDYYSKAGISFKADDAGSGIVAYGINKSSTVEPTYTTVTSTNSIGKVFVNITENGTYYVWVKDAVGNVSNKAVTVDKVDTTAPAISEVYSGGMIYTDPTFSSGNNSIYVYNWREADGTVTIERVAMATPEGNYALEITTNGEAYPGLGGFYFRTPVEPNEIMVTRILAKIPVGYSIEWITNQIGTDGTHTWLTDTAGTGEWKEYVVKVTVGSSGTFEDTNFFYLTGEAATAENPVTWYIAYATVYSNSKAGVSFKAEDAGSGIVAYGINMSSTTEPTYTTITSTNSIVRVLENIKENGTYYVWVKDAAGNVSNKAITVSNIDKTPPTCSFGAPASSTIYTGDSTTMSLSYGDATSVSISSTSGLTAARSGTTVTLTGTTTGTKYVTATCTDAAGNSATATSSAITVVNRYSATQSYTTSVKYMSLHNNANVLSLTSAPHFILSSISTSVSNTAVTANVSGTVYSGTGTTYFSGNARNMCLTAGNATSCASNSVQVKASSTTWGHSSGSTNLSYSVSGTFTVAPSSTTTYYIAIFHDYPTHTPSGSSNVTVYTIYEFSTYNTNQSGDSTRSYITVTRN